VTANFARKDHQAMLRPDFNHSRKANWLRIRHCVFLTIFSIYVHYRHIETPFLHRLLVININNNVFKLLPFSYQILQFRVMLILTNDVIFVLM
jgi:hypothetical protein